MTAAWSKSSRLYFYKVWKFKDHRSIVSLISPSCGNIARVPSALGQYSRNFGKSASLLTSMPVTICTLSCLGAAGRTWRRWSVVCSCRTMSSLARWTRRWVEALTRLCRTLFNICCCCSATSGIRGRTWPPASRPSSTATASWPTSAAEWSLPSSSGVQSTRGRKLHFSDSAQNFNFAPKFPQNGWYLYPNSVFWMNVFRQKKLGGCPPEE